MNTNEQRNFEPSGEFAASIRDFRAAVTHVADRETARAVAADWLAPARKRRAHHQRMTLSWACAALLCLATLPWLGHSRPAATPHPIAQVPATAAAPESDSALLEQVDADVSESVPSSLEPLAELDTWNTASMSTIGDSHRNGAALTQTEKQNVAR
jgi:hypothetical protein